MSLPELRVLLSERTRLPTRLDNGHPGADPGPDSATILSGLMRDGAPRPEPRAARWVLSGGEPTLRADLLRLIRELTGAGAPPLVLHTDGLALSVPGAIEALMEAGLRRVRIDLTYSPGFAAHDWLMRTPGAGARAADALRRCRAAGLETEAEVVLTRPTTPLLGASVEALIALGAARVRVRRLRAAGAAAADFVALSPRLGLAEPQLLAALETAEHYRRPLSLHGFPACAVGMRPVVAPPELLCAADGQPLPDAPTLPGCARCPGPPACPGAPADYVSRFGWSELRSEDSPPHRLPTDRIPPARAGLSPATRVAATRSREPAPPRPPPEALRVQTRADEPTRSLRTRLLRASEEGASELHLCGALEHPELVDLLRDAARLPFRGLHAAGPAARPLGEAELRRVRRWDSFQLAFYGPDAASHDAVAGPGAMDTTLANARALAQHTPARVGAYAVLRDPGTLPAWDEAWASGRLPGEPRFRLAASGGDLSAIVDQLPALSEPTRSALARVLPACLGGQLSPPPPLCEPSHQDPDDPSGPYTRLDPCACGRRCPGLPAAWRAPDRSPP